MSSTTTEETTKRQMVEDDPPERELETEDAGTAFEGAETGDQEKEDPDALFDAKRYEGPLALPKIDGEGVDKIAVKFSGTVILDRSDEADVELMKRMKLGHDVTLQIEGRCAKKGHGYTTSREGELDAVVLQHAIAVHTVYRPTLEDDAG
jgi:hypothetical protein